MHNKCGRLNGNLAIITGILNNSYLQLLGLNQPLKKALDRTETEGLKTRQMYNIEVHEFQFNDRIDHVSQVQCFNS